MNGFGRGEDKQNEEKSRASVMTRETVGMTLLLFSAVIFFIMVTGKYIFGEVGVAIAAFFLGLFGFLAYPLLAYAIARSVLLIVRKKKLPVKWPLRIGFAIVCVFLIVHTATSARFFGGGFGTYLTGCWNAAQTGAKGATGGGVIFGLVVYPIRALLSNAGAYVVFSLLLLLSVFLIVMATPLGKRIKGLRRRGRAAEEKDEKDAKSFDDLEPSRPARTDAQTAPDQGYAPQNGYVPQDGYAPPYSGYNPPQSQFAQQGAPYGYAPQNAYGEPPREPYAYAPPARESAPASEYDRSREILFGGTNSAESYRENLTFDRDSYYNTRARAAGARPQTQAAPSRPVQEEPYSARWGAAAESPRPQMPRKVSTADELGSGGYSFNSNDISYPQTPSYRAAATEENKPERKPERDFYQNDVPYEEDYSSAPNVYEEPQTEREPEEPVRKPASTRRNLVSRASRADSAEEMPDGDNIISGLFSRSTGETRTVIPDPEEGDFSENPRVGFESRSETLRSTEDFGRRETPRSTEDFGRAEEFDRGDPVRDFTRGQEDSRVFDAPPMRRSAADVFDDDEAGEAPEASEEPALRRTIERRLPVEREEERPARKKHVYSRYVAPIPSLLLDRDDTSTVSQQEIETNSETIVDTLQSYRVDAEIAGVTCGCAVTRYDVQIPKNIPVNMVIKRSSELAMRLRSKNGVNIYANYEHGAISIEVPNAKRATVGMKPLVTAEAFYKTKPSALTFAIGKDIDGRCVYGDIDEMTHLLIAGTTGSGKSICLHTLICSLLYRYSPEELRFILVDPKKNEFTIYEGLPHLMINEVINDAQKAVVALNWAIKEMERRYTLFNEKTRAGYPCRKIDEYNEKLVEDEERLPKIVIVVDELADLMSAAKKEIEERIQRIAQKARAAGIHLVLATQRPSVDVVTGVIKGNLPTCFAFCVRSEIDSRVILDEGGAEKLLGRGDLIFTAGKKRMRVQGSYLDPDEVQAIVDFIKENNEAYFDEDVSDYVNKPAAEGLSGGSEEGGTAAPDAKYVAALAMVVKLGTASISLIQRRCSVGYSHAGKIMEWMESNGYVSPFDGTSKPRAVLLTVEEYESKYGKLD